MQITRVFAFLAIIVLIYSYFNFSASYPPSLGFSDDLKFAVRLGIEYDLSQLIVAMFAIIVIIIIIFLLHTLRVINYKYTLVVAPISILFLICDWVFVSRLDILDSWAHIDNDIGLITWIILAICLFGYPIAAMIYNVQELEKKP